ncbi:alpha/beta fold hydrolase [Nocardia sp. NPDC049149]|uniref:alpha/beta fold hydrolase n=1 Tax=Nocardia sp. NPDC049149 TaxID=3364315 RepID=UPI00372438E1
MTEDMAPGGTPEEAAELAALSAGIGADLRHRFTEIDGLRIHYVEAGSGDPLILLHGWPQHWWEWRHVIGPLATHYRVICPDIRGMGWSEGSVGGYRFERLARDLLDLMDQLGVRRARLVGRDWGLVVGYRACLNWPERFTQLVAMAGVHPWTVAGGALPVYTRPWHVYVLAALGRSRRVQARLVARAFTAWRHRGRYTIDETEVYLRRMRTTGAHQATRGFNRNLMAHEVPHFALRHRLLRLRVPTLHLNGDRDPLSAGVPQSYRDYADDMRLESIVDCGHFIPEEQPAVLVDRLLRFFDAGTERTPALSEPEVVSAG